MDVEVVENKERKAVLYLNKVPVSLLNALRRTIIAGLPTFAVDEVHFYENNSPMYNEYIANRVGLIPLTYEETVADDSQVTFSLDAEAIDEPRMVYSREMTGSDQAIRVFAENVPVIKLNKGQRLRFEAIAKKGEASEHAKYQSALASYGLLGEFKLADKCRKCSAPIKVREEALAAKITKANAPATSLLCSQCEEKAAPEKESEEYVFAVESFNNLSAAQQLERALKAIGDKLDALAKELK